MAKIYHLIQKHEMDDLIFCYRIYVIVIIYIFVVLHVWCLVDLIKQQIYEIVALVKFS